MTPRRTEPIPKGTAESAAAASSDPGVTSDSEAAADPDDVATAADLAILRRLHTETFGDRNPSVHPLKGDASDRRIYRLRGHAHTSIGIIGPNREENRAFIGFARTFRALGLHVPEIFAVETDERCYLEEDLGDVTLSMWTEDRRTQARTPDTDAAGADAAGTDAAGADAAGADAAGADAAGTDAAGTDAAITDMYTRVLGDLLRFQIDAADAVDYGLCYQYPEFGPEAMAFDIRYFRTMFLEPLVRVPWDRAAFDRETAALIAELLTADRSHFLYRDFQSRNIMIRNGAPWFIDFQSGRRGALHYDVAALLYDSRGGLDDATRRVLLGRYLDALALRMDVDRARFQYLFEGFAVLRLMQALGAFGNAGLNRGRPEYLDLIPSRLRALAGVAGRAAMLDALPSLRTLFTAAAEAGGTVSPKH